MKKDEWKRILENWEASKKLRKLREKAMYKGIFSLTTTELIEEMDSIEDFVLSLSEEERAEYDFIDEDGLGMDKMDVTMSFSQMCVKWHFYLKKYELAEQYEICARILKILGYEKEEVIRMFRVHFPLEEDENDEALLDEIILQSRAQMEINYKQIKEALK